MFMIYSLEQSQRLMVIAMVKKKWSTSLSPFEFWLQSPLNVIGDDEGLMSFAKIDRL